MPTIRPTSPDMRSTSKPLQPAKRLVSWKKRIIVEDIYIKTLEKPKGLKFSVAYRRDYYVVLLIFQVIRRDIARTYPEHDFFKEKDGLGQESLFNVMKAYSLHDREVGYCQGSAFIVGLLLMQVKTDKFNYKIQLSNFLQSILC